MTNIGYNAFLDCSSLKYNEYDNAYYLGNESNPYVILIKVKDKSITNYTINNMTKCIGPYAFSDCSKLTSIIIPDGVTSIGYDAFGDCSSLTSIEVPDGVTNIGDFAFGSCSSLESITIPDSVTSIGYYAFNHCSSLTSITYNGTTKQWNAITKEINWNEDTVDYTISGTDGEIRKG